MRVESDNLRARDERLRWHCRRALLELDIVFSRFWAERGDTPLSEVEAEELTALLELEDHPLWHLIGQADSEPGDKGLLQKLRRL